MAEQAPASKEPEAGAATSKNALKKAQKEKEKAEKKAAAKAKQLVVTQQQEPSEDLAKNNYGREVSLSTDAPEINLRSLSEEHIGKPVILRAWVQNVRLQSAKMAFMELREEGNWAIQGVLQVTGDADAENAHVISRPMVKWTGALNPESFVVVEAIVQRPYEPVKSCKVANYELHIRKCFLIAAAPAMLGMTLAAANRPVSSFNDDEELREEASQTAVPGATLLTHLDNIVIHKRAPVQQAISDVRCEIKHLFRSYLRSHGFKEFEPPCLIGAASEGGANVFTLPYFNQEACLAQSPQFYKQMEIAGGRKRVFSIGPVFRAENSNTTRHMTEFTGLDMEMEITKDYKEVLLMLEGVLLHIFRGIKEHCAEEMELIRSIYPGDELLLPEPGKEVRLTFAEGQQLLRSEGPEEYRNVRDDEDMSTPQEKALGALIRKKFNTDFYVLDKFPEDARPFYAKIDPASAANGSKVTNAFDFFLCGQEILSGGQRINDPDELEDRIRVKGVDPKSPGIREYVDVFRQAGVPPHGGGGIGLDRVVAWCLNLPSVHLAAYYPRTPKRLFP
ncbi:aspartyl-tRNA synthetase [Cucurbitaria berberidis CBS 394.84]|uniref:Probable aspartate--tRNA ligase, cytoplasmic n=1 Tax=Cucurbitaria berberidis CBS 394.84 TaxID=1168544 RepID=A0A9P4L5Z8_9PLEO|nr:aspartyl-tRNA synthetase [Cucurbitaria berberidis CBS 394.84]KAF1843456.1 aspartyl-tRNA synthetase [Cucurbitaria berberidis CBS 394.84]